MKQCLIYDNSWRFSKCAAATLAFIAFLILLISILKKGLRLLRLENANGAIVGGLLLSLIAVFTLHLTTPYLNHPLGLGFILISLCAFAILDPRYAEK